MDDIELWAQRLKAVGHPVRLVVLLGLYASSVLQKSPHSLRYSEIKELTESPHQDNGGLDYHLKALLEAKVISKEPTMDADGKPYALYHLTEEGRTTLEQLGIQKVFDAKLRELAGPE